MTAREIMAALSAHFPADAISWRVGSTNKKNWQQGKPRRGLPLAYIDARDVMERLDAVMGADWQCEYVPMPNGTCCCRIGIKIDGEWRWRSNGAVNIADDGDRAEAKEMAEKGSYSDAFKRAAVLWGIGQYLYAVKAPWLELDEYWGIRDADMPKLRALLMRQGAPASETQPKEPAAQQPRAEPPPAHSIQPPRSAPADNPTQTTAKPGNRKIDPKRSMDLANKMLTALSFVDSPATLKQWAKVNGKNSPMWREIGVGDQKAVEKAYFRKMDEVSKPKATIDPETGEIVVEPEAAAA